MTSCADLCLISPFRQKVLLLPMITIEIYTQRSLSIDLLLKTGKHGNVCFSNFYVLSHTAKYFYLGNCGCATNNSVHYGCQSVYKLLLYTPLLLLDPKAGSRFTIP